MKAWLEAGYDASTLKHREFLTSIILSYKPTSVLDVGCASGPDLYLLRLQKPKLKLEGLNDECGDAKKANSICKVTCGDLRDLLPQYPDKSFDVVFSNGVIMYVEPKWVAQMQRIARKAVILSEKNPYNSFSVEDYTQYLTKTTKITEEVRPSWKNDGYIYELTPTP